MASKGDLALGGALVLLALAVGLRVLVFGLVTVETGSMQPAVREGETLLYLKRSEPKPGDVVVVELPWEPGVLHVKRLVAVGPAEVELQQGHLYLNGAPVFEEGQHQVSWTDVDCGEHVGPALAERYGEQEVMVLAGGSHARTQLRGGEAWVLGDRRGRSEDSGQWGVIPMSALRGRVWRTVGAGLCPRLGEAG